MELPIEAFCLNGCGDNKIALTITKVLGYPNETSYEGGYDVVCTLELQVGSYRIAQGETCSATGALYRFREELQKCYQSLAGVANYCLLLENDLAFSVEMKTGGRAVIKGSYQEQTHMGNKLQFEIETDQSCFLPAIESIQRLQSQFGDYEGILRS